MELTQYFFDTYAAIELLRKNPGYQKYVNEKIRITFLNLLEIAYIVFTQHGEKEAFRSFMRFKEFVIEIPDEVVMKAVRYRAEHRRKSLSHADSLGYIYSQHSGLIFITGDDAFKDLPGVDFVK